jgi:hypothetical protein
VAAVNRREKRRMEELTGVAHSAEVKQRQQNRTMRATSCGGGRRPAAREDGWDTGGHWDGVDGARRWPVTARRWSAAEEWGR